MQSHKVKVVDAWWIRSEVVDQVGGGVKVTIMD
jgi:hypothetical protein